MANPAQPNKPNQTKPTPPYKLKGAPKPSQAGMSKKVQKQSGYTKRG